MLSANCRQPIVINKVLPRKSSPLYNCHQPMVTNQLLPTICHQPIATNQLSPTNCHPQNCHQPIVINHLPPTNCHQPIATHNQLSPTNCHQPIVTNRCAAVICMAGAALGALQGVGCMPLPASLAHAVRTPTTHPKNPYMLCVHPPLTPRILHSSTLVFKRNLCSVC